MAHRRDLLAEDIDEDDIESLLIQQIEFCSTLILNKTDTVSPEQIAELKAIVRSLQKAAAVETVTMAVSPSAPPMTPSSGATTSRS